MESINTLQLNDITIICRSSDGFIDATELCRAGGKTYKAWSLLKSTKKLLEGYEKYNNNENNSVDFIGQDSLPINLIKLEDSGRGDRTTWVHK